MKSYSTTTKQFLLKFLLFFNLITVLIFFYSLPQFIFYFSRIKIINGNSLNWNVWFDGRCWNEESCGLWPLALSAKPFPSINYHWFQFSLLGFALSFKEKTSPPLMKEIKVFSSSYTLKKQKHLFLFEE